MFKKSNPRPPSPDNNVLCVEMKELSSLSKNATTEGQRPKGGEAEHSPSSLLPQSDVKTPDNSSFTSFVSPPRARTWSNLSNESGVSGYSDDSRCQSEKREARNANKTSMSTIGS